VMERKDPNCMFVDPGMMTCYPTNQTVARQNEYTRVICEYLPLSSPSPSATLRLFAFRLPFGISFTLRPAAGSSVCVWPRPTLPHDHQCPICFPHTFLVDPDQPPTRPNLDISRVHPGQANSASRHSSTTPFTSVPYRTPELC